MAALVAGGLVGLSAPAAAAPAGPGDGRSGAAPDRSAVAWEDPVPGTSAEITFTDATTPARAASLPPHLAEIVREAARVRTVDIEARALHPSLAAESVAIELFDDVTIDLATSVALSEGVGSGSRSSSVYSAGGGDGSALLTLIGGDVHGALWKGATRYGIEPLGNGRHLVFADGRTFPDEATPVADAAGAAPPATPAGPGTLATTVIDVMVAFDEEAQATFGGVAATEAEVMEMVNVTNLAYANSQVDVQLALTGILDLNYTPNAADGTTDDRFYFSSIRGRTDGIVDNLHAERDASGADLVAAITNATAFCGVGRLPTSSDPAELDAFTLTDDTCAVGNLSFPHEIGHNLCAHHDPDNAGGNPCDADAFGHFSSADGLRTVMAYPNPCGGCTRIPHFSNPDVAFEGWTTGILGSRNNSRVLGVRAPDIAAYRGSGPGPAACEVGYTIAQTWPGNVEVHLEVVNNTTSWINGWTAEWTFTGDESVTGSWGVVVSQVGAEATATGDSWGAMIAPGGTVTVGFQATVTGSPTVPSPITCDA